MGWLEEYTQRRLAELEAARLLRKLETVEKTEGPWIWIGGAKLLSFASNDYLGLAQSRGAEPLEGTGASRLLAGTRPEHAALEARMAAFKGAQGALFFTSAYLANMGLVSSLRPETIVSDELNHASLIDAARLSGARIRIFPHRDAVGARRELSAATGRALLLTESLFSMDGDLAPLEELAEACRVAGAELVVDDTHATGILGPGGRGLAAGTHVCNLGKAGGLIGGFVVGSRALVTMLTTTARTFVYTTSLPAGVCRAALAAIDLLEAADGARAKLRENCRRLEEGLKRLGAASDSRGPIFPVRLGSADRALAAAEQLRERGFFLPAIRPPTVPEGTSRLRVSLTALHEPEHLDALLSALGAL